MEDLCLLLRVDLPLDPLVEDLSLVLSQAPALVPEAVLVVVLVVVLAWVVTAAALDLAPAAGRGI